MLSIDVGTTATAAAVEWAGERHVLELDGYSSTPSTVLAPDQGALVVGRSAEAQAALEPERVERTPKRRLGDPVLLLGARAVEPVDAVAAILGHVRGIAVASAGGDAPAKVVLTHPARWGAARLDLLREAARRAHLPEPVLVPEPVAAAAHLASDLAAPGDLLAVYDLGGGTFDAAVVRRTSSGFELAGPPGGDETLGGEVLDDRVVADLLAGLPPDVAEALTSGRERPWRQAGAGLRQGARLAKEALSTAESYTWYLGPPADTELTLSSTRLESLIEGPIVATVQALVDAIARSGLSPDRLAAIVMVGGGARTPMVGRVLTQVTGRAPVTWGDPKAAVCLGALAVIEAVDIGPPGRLTAEVDDPRPNRAPRPRHRRPRTTWPTRARRGQPPSCRSTPSRARPPSPSRPPNRSRPLHPNGRRPSRTSPARPSRERPRWRSRPGMPRIGTFLAIFLVLLGVASAIVAILLA